MKKAIATLGLLAFAGALGGCAYSGVSVSGSQAVVLRNDLFLYGVLRKAFVCKVADSGLSGCQANENP